MLLLAWKEKAGPRFCLLPLPDLKGEKKKLKVKCLNRKPSDLSTPWSGFGKHAILCNRTGLLDAVNAVFKRLKVKL